MDEEFLIVHKDIARDVLRYIDAMKKMVDDFDLSKWGVIVSHYLYGGDTDNAFDSIEKFRKIVEG